MSFNLQRIPGRRRRVLVSLRICILSLDLLLVLLIAGGHGTTSPPDEHRSLVEDSHAALTQERRGANNYCTDIKRESNFPHI